ncbi:MAG: BsuBI/PstI family type II restriction endonuclease [Thermoguttaceae bacterium]|jgi:adenine-specific DNA-methyltransferase
MGKKEDALEILRFLGLPVAQQNERSALTLLALAGLGPSGAWSNTKKPRLRIWDIMRFMRDKYGKDYAANSRETIRRQTIHQFEQARLIDRNPDDPLRPTNSGNNCYALTDDACKVLKTYGSPKFHKAVDLFIEKYGQLAKSYDKQRDLLLVELKLPDNFVIRLSPGTHNALQVAVIKDFGPRFASGAKLLFIGDTAHKHVICETETLAELRINITEHNKLPDIILYDEKRKWLFLIEAVTSHGPVNPKRHSEIETMLSDCKAERIYVTAFIKKADFRRFAGDIAWETEVWIAESPDHMIHFNGPKFLGPYKSK